MACETAMENMSGQIEATTMANGLKIKLMVKEN
jgi:hypothetical protein